MPHGLANAMLLGQVMKYNASKCKLACRKYAELARVTGLCSYSSSDSEAIEAFVDKISDMMERMKMPKTLTSFGVNRQQVADALSEIVNNTLKAACLSTNPIKPSKHDIEQLVKEIL